MLMVGWLRQNRTLPAGPTSIQCRTFALRARSIPRYVWEKTHARLQRGTGVFYTASNLLFEETTAWHNRSQGCESLPILTRWWNKKGFEPTGEFEAYALLVIVLLGALLVDAARHRQLNRRNENRR